MKRIMLVPAVLCCLISACKKSSNSSNSSSSSSSVPDCSGGTPSYASAVSPLIASSCGINGCHGSGNGNGPGPLVTYAQIKNAASSIRASVLNGSMPQGSKLSDAQKSTIICWIDAGTPNN